MLHHFSITIFHDFSITIIGHVSTQFTIALDTSAIIIWRTQQSAFHKLVSGLLILGLNKNIIILK